MNKIYVGNLPFSTTDDSLREAFRQYGNIQEVALIKDHYTGKSKGFGFITYASQQEATAALVMNGQAFEGRTLKVNMARENTGGGGGSGGRRREGGGNGGGWGRRDQY